MTLSLEPTAIGFYIAILVTIFLSYTVIRRMKQDSSRKGENVGCFTGAYISLVIGSLSLLFFPFTAILIETTAAYIEYPRYESIVVDVESGWEEQSYTDSDGRTRSEDVLMHTAIIEFTDNNGEKIRMPNSFSSGEKPNIEDTIIVSYKDGKLLEFSFSAIGLFIGLAFMLLIMGFCLLLIFNFGAGKSNKNLFKTAQSFGIYFVAPASMLLMFILLAYVVVQYFLGYKEDMPGFVVGLLIFFCSILLLAFIGYLKMVFSGEISDEFSD